MPWFSLLYRSTVWCVRGPRVLMRTPLGIVKPWTWESGSSQSVLPLTQWKHSYHTYRKRLSRPDWSFFHDRQLINSQQSHLLLVSLVVRIFSLWLSQNRNYNIISFSLFKFQTSCIWWIIFFFLRLELFLVCFFERVLKRNGIVTIVPLAV